MTLLSSHEEARYEKPYLYTPNGGIEVDRSLIEYFSYYYHKRKHSGINNLIPKQEYS